MAGATGVGGSGATSEGEGRDAFLRISKPVVGRVGGAGIDLRGIDDELVAEALEEEVVQGAGCCRHPFRVFDREGDRPFTGCEEVLECCEKSLVALQAGDRRVANFDVSGKRAHGTSYFERSAG